jgi:glycosyltransferase involved in cell wall biosynthesis
LTDEELQVRGWNNANIICRGWASQSELPHILSGADILFLPYTFVEEFREIVETAFPSKMADYLAAAKPILVFGPPYSTLVRYASQLGFAEIVDEFSEAALARAIKKLVFSPSCRERLAANALEVLAANHDISYQQVKLYTMLERICAISQKRSDCERLKRLSHRG